MPSFALRITRLCGRKQVQQRGWFDLSPILGAAVEETVRVVVVVAVAIVLAVVVVVIFLVLVLIVMVGVIVIVAALFPVLVPV